MIGAWIIYEKIHYTFLPEGKNNRSAMLLTVKNKEYNN